MRYRKLGNTGLIVSSVALGTMQFGGKMNMGNLGQEDTTRMVKLALDRGINFIDTADVYSLGESETLVGNALKGVRSEIVLATKVRLPMSENFNRSGATRVNIMREVEGSLRRLQTDYIDLYQVHGWDSNTPLEETLRTLDDLVRQGKVRYIGLSEAGPATIRRAHAVHPVAALQTEYSLWTRDPEAELLPLLRELGIGFVPYSPLGHGFLTGDIRSPEQLSDDDWRKTNPRFTAENFQRNLRIVDEVEAVAAEAGATPAQIALAWLLAQGDDIAPIPGTKRVARVEENTAADRIELSAEQVERLNNLTPAAGERQDEGNMAVIER